MPFYQNSNSNDETGLNSLYFSDIFILDHFHKNPEAIFVFNGSCTIKVSNTSFVMKENQCAFILSNQIHSVTVDKESKIGICVFPESLVPEFSKAISGKECLCPVFDATPQAKAAFEVIMAPCDRLTLCSCLYALCHGFVSCAKLCSVTSRRGCDDSDLAHRIIIYISENFTDESISLKKAAAHLGYDKNYVSRIFHKAFSTGFCETVNSHRIELARKLLDNENLSVTEVAYKCVFSTPRSFNRSFIKFCGITPLGFKKQMRNSNSSTNTQTAHKI